jgi:mycothiol synthase
MGSLSNFLRRGDAPRPVVPPSVTPPSATRYRPVVQAEVHACLRLILGSHGRGADNAQVLDFLQFAVHRHIALADLWLAERDGRIVWAVLPIVSPGRTMLLLTPTHHPTTPNDPAATQLTDAVCAHFAGRGIRLAQALLEPTDVAARPALEAAGFHAMAGLDYLHAGVRRTYPPPKIADALSWVRYTPETHDLFVDTISGTYQGSLDCPALNGVRDMEDVLAGHKASGEFDPSLWFLLHEATGRGDASALGTVLLSRMTKSEAMELVYLGLSPHARGRGLGDLLVRQALAATAASGVSKLSLAVDSANRPALGLYHRHGFQQVGHKLAMMKMLQPRGTHCDDTRQENGAERHVEIDPTVRST